VVIRAVVFDIGGVLEITPDLGVDRAWEARLGLPAGVMAERLRDVWLGGAIGTITLDDVHQAITDRLGLGERQLAAFMADLWREYLGTADAELIEYARGLRPRYRTGILSNRGMLAAGLVAVAVHTAGYMRLERDQRRP